MFELISRRFDCVSPWDRYPHISSYSNTRVYDTDWSTYSHIGRSFKVFPRDYSFVPNVWISVWRI